MSITGYRHTGLCIEMRTGIVKQPTVDDFSMLVYTNCPAHADTFFIADSHDACSYYWCNHGGFLQGGARFPCAPGTAVPRGYGGIENPCTVRQSTCLISPVHPGIKHHGPPIHSLPSPGIPFPRPPVGYPKPFYPRIRPGLHRPFLRPSSNSFYRPVKLIKTGSPPQLQVVYAKEGSDPAPPPSTQTKVEKPFKVIGPVPVVIEGEPTPPKESVPYRRPGLIDYLQNLYKQSQIAQAVAKEGREENNSGQDTATKPPPSGIPYHTTSGLLREPITGGFQDLSSTRVTEQQSTRRTFTTTTRRIPVTASTSLPRTRTRTPARPTARAATSRPTTTSRSVTQGTTLSPTSFPTSIGATTFPDTTPTPPGETGKLQVLKGLSGSQLQRGGGTGQVPSGVPHVAFKVFQGQFLLPVLRVNTATQCLNACARFYEDCAGVDFYPSREECAMYDEDQECSGHLDTSNGAIHMRLTDKC
ncbi:hypothetical protein CAPTEDRAFT_221051 [Capitella teleta]|uniref:Apple domain-containing protein n=1 Tax=Capitella teleta TaxID=283909 RepID=R7UL38_CAPTE|nr:hypothetical protein CAPTEDRAFT_221051 [Capitella teleta]|eukprot:ELU04503.1 hypothetical protein CAPTEDRAFT_221051 [Capitella teleta]